MNAPKIKTVSYAFNRGKADYLKWAALDVADKAPPVPYFPGSPERHEYECGWKLENNDLFDIIAAFH